MYNKGKEKRDTGVSMFKSVFLKFVTWLSLIILFSFFILATVISSVVTEHINTHKADDIYKTAKLFSATVEISFSEKDEPFAALLSLDEKVASEIEEHIAGLEEAGAFIVRADGLVLFKTQNVEDKVPNQINKEFLEEVWLLQAGNPNAASSILIEDKYPLSFSPINIDEGGEESDGFVFVFAISPNRAQLLDATTQTVLMSCIWVMLATLIAVYFITERMVDPIKRMSDAAESYAKGNFSSRIDVIGQDEIAELSSAFNQMAEDLDRLEKMRNSFLANVSHDLRTPMTSIAGFIEGGAIPPEKHPYYLNLISSEIHRLSRLVSQILDISRLESGERRLHFAPCNICETARLVLISFEAQIEEKELDVSFEAEEDSLYITADADALHQVLYNLCENALKFSFSKGRLQINIEKGEKDTVVFSVYNEGQGIPEEDLPYVFDKFYKSDKSRGLDKNGVGLGLYIVKSLVESHNGEISVSSEYGKYCRFALSFPSAEK